MMENKEQQNQLGEAAKALFDSFDTPELIKLFFWDILSAAMGSNQADEWDGQQRSDTLFFYKLMCGLIEAVYPLYESDRKIL